MKRFIILSALVLGLFSFFLSDIGRFLTLDTLKQNQQALTDYYKAHELQTVVTFLVLYVVQTVFSLPGAAVLSIAAGAVFGVWPGALYVNISASTGATLAFLAARYLFHDGVQERFGHRLGKLNAELERGGFGYLLFLRLVPLFPFFLINLAAGITPIKLRTFFFATVVGIVPASFVFCNAGAGLASIKSTDQIFSGRVIASLSLLGAFALVPTIFSRLKNRKAHTSR